MGPLKHALYDQKYMYSMVVYDTWRNLLAFAFINTHLNINPFTASAWMRNNKATRMI